MEEIKANVKIKMQKIAINGTQRIKMRKING
jgi:hypothetical protein